MRNVYLMNLYDFSALDNLCLHMNDPCEPRWRLEVDELELGDQAIVREPNKGKSNQNRQKICDWCGIMSQKTSYLFYFVHIDRFTK